MAYNYTVVYIGTAPEAFHAKGQVDLGFIIT